MIRRPPRSTRTDTLFPYTTLFRSSPQGPVSVPWLLASKGFGFLKDQMMPPPSIRRMTPITMTTILRFRPLVLSDIAPSASPMTAKGMITQFAQPSSGMKAKTARTRAIAPMMSDPILSMAMVLARRRRCGKSLSVRRWMRSLRLVALGSCNAIGSRLVFSPKHPISPRGRNCGTRKGLNNAYSHQRPDGRVRRRQRPRHHAAPRRRDDPRQGAGLSRVRTIVGLLRSEEHTSELQSLMHISYAVFCLQKKTNTQNT